MSATYPGGCGVAAIRSVGDATALRATDWLCLGAAPTFAIMALLTCVFGGQTDILCSATAPTSPLTGMIPMYLLMSAFHSSSWLKLMSSRRNFTDRIEPPHSNRRSPRMLSGRWVLGRQTRNLVPFWPGLGRWPGRAAMAGKGHGSG